MRRRKEGRKRSLGDGAEKEERSEPNSSKSESGGDGIKEEEEKEEELSDTFFFFNRWQWRKFSKTSLRIWYVYHISILKT